MNQSAAEQRPLRIVHTESSCGWGGQELRILSESAGLVRRGHDVRIVCPREAPIYEAARRRQLAVEALPIQRRKPRSLRAALRWLKANRADVINTHSSTDSWLFSLATRLAARHLPVVRTRHISAPVSRDLATRWLYVRGARQVVTCGERIRQTLVADSRIPGDRLVSIPTGIDTDHFVPGDRDAARRQLGLPTDRTLIGIVATLRSWKGHKYLIDAFHHLDDPNAQLLIVGGGPQRENLEKQIAALELSDRVLMPGNQENVLPWLRALDVFALPSYANEGVPQALLQALACELPVVTTPVGSIEEAVTHAVTGLLVPPQDAQALAAAIKVLNEHESLRRRFGAAGRQRVVATFGLDGMLDAMEAVFRSARSAA